MQFQKAYVLGWPPEAVPWATGGASAEEPITQEEKERMQEGGHAAGSKGSAEDRQAEGDQAAAGHEEEQQHGARDALVQDDWCCDDLEDEPGPFLSGFEDR